jgi:hypothetical protein
LSRQSVTDGGKAVSLRDRPRSTPEKNYFCDSDTHFCQRLSKPQRLLRLVGSHTFGVGGITSSGLEPTTFRSLTLPPGIRSQG